MNIRNHPEINKLPPIGVVKAIFLKSNELRSFVASPYIEPEKSTTPISNKSQMIFFLFKDNLFSKPKNIRSKACIK